MQTLEQIEPQEQIAAPDLEVLRVLVDLREHVLQKQRIFLSNGSASGGFEMQTVAGGNDLHWLIDGANDLILKTNSVIRGRMTSGGNHFLSGEGGLAASATDGFPYVTSVAGIPTGTPTSETNMSPFVLNRTDNIWYFYDGANWVPIGNPALVDLQLMAEQTGVPSNAAYPVTVVAPIITDANDGDLKVAAYDDTTEEGRSFDLFIPPGATRIEFQWKSRGDGSSGNVRPKGYFKKYPDGSAPDSAFTAFSAAFSDIAIPATADFVYDMEILTLPALA